MHNEIQISDGFYYVGGSDRRIQLFENVYPLTNGVSYNSYLYLDEKTAVFDTVDKAISDVYFENVEFLLSGRELDYLIVSHVEPDHASNINELLRRHPETTIVTNMVAKRFLLNFFPTIKAKFLVVKEGDSLSIGKHSFSFLMAPFVHWPEVMFTYEKNEGVLFSADAFGTFGALNGDLCSSIRNFDIDEFRRYYANIVGGYGPQVLGALKKVALLNVRRIAPLHGPLHTNDIPTLIDLYEKWSSYEPEDDDGVLIIYGSIYGNTANVSDILAAKLATKDLRNIAVYDVSKTDASILISESFRVKTIVLAASTYNGAPFIKMTNFLRDLVEHKIQGRTFALIENGTWAPGAKKGMLNIIGELKDSTFIENGITINSTLKENQLKELETLANAIAEK